MILKQLFTKWRDIDEERCKCPSGHVKRIEGKIQVIPDYQVCDKELAWRNYTRARDIQMGLPQHVQLWELPRQYHA